MGIVGRYLDALSDEQRDRVIEVQEMISGDYVDDNGARCLVGAAEGPDEQPVAEEIGEADNLVGVECGFDTLWDRFGKARIVAACKARAAKGNRLHEIRAEVYAAQRTAFMYGSTLLDG